MRKGEAYRVNREFLSKIRDDFNIVISNIEEFKKEYPQIKNGFSLLGSVIATELCNNGIVTKTEEAGPYVFTIIPMIDDLTGEAKKWDV